MLGAGCGGGARTERDPDATAGTGASGGPLVGGVDGGGDLPGGTGGFAMGGGGTGGFTTGGGTGGFATGGGGTGGFATGGGGTGGFATGGGTGGFATGGGGTGGSTAQSLVVEEDDPALCGALGTVANARGGFRGAGYLDTEDLPGAGISWVVHATAAGQYELGWRYASDGATRQARLRIAHEHAQDVEFPPPEDGAWGDRVVTATLAAGDNHLSLVAQEAVGLPDIDSLTVYGAGVTAATCLEYAPGADLIFSAPQFTEASVHDPSVVKTGDDFYVFGSHLAAAKTADLMNWVQVARDGVTAQNPLFEDVVAELTEAFTWSTVVGLWAADVRQLRSTGRFLMYYNSCEGSSPLSAMGIASAASIEGPYTNEGVFLRSGGPGYDASTLPNAIDPHVFYDDEDTLWMVYGSYSGGIYLMRLNPETGFPLAGQEYGTHLLGGNHIQIEGPFIQHGPERGYYYLFTSYGGLAAGDGYNIRVARSRTAAGPYLDHAGVDQATVRSRPFDASGVKLLGDHLWADTEGTQGYVSPGHNSSYYDEASGRYFLVFHARFPGRGNLHQIRVHQMYLNVDGWPVVAPLRYAPRGHGSTLSDAAVDYVGLGEVAGSYQFVNHGRDTSGVIKESVPATLNPDRTVGGALAGTWKYAGDSVLVLDVDGGSFRGVLSRQWNEHAREFQITFTGVDARGISLWGLRVGN